MSKIFNIPCVWQQYGILKIEADSLDEAAMIAEGSDTALPKDSSYVMGSFEVDHDAIECYNEDSSTD